jgi:hypothetical protein
MINLDIDIENIQKSFDKIACDIIHNWHLKINDDLYSFTEIEFYFFFKGIHEDNATHKHKYPKGQWRSHPAGLDITFQSSDVRDGGILIRGMKKDTKYVNGPRRIVELIFESFGDITLLQKEFGLVRKLIKTREPIRKVARHGLSNSQKNKYKDHPYRYIIDIDAWDQKHMSKSQKENIKKSWADCSCYD